MRVNRFFKERAHYLFLKSEIPIILRKYGKYER